jgi:glycosyltransferase involved in cell wall biosynthesis
VGDGPERASLEADLQQRGIADAAHFAGAVPPGQVPGLLASMDAAVAPYGEQESFYFSPLKVYEYMAAGVPVVASRIGQLADVIEDGVNGILCPPGDSRALAEALLRLHSDPSMRARLGERARQTIMQGHTWHDVGMRIIELAHISSPYAPLVGGR